MESRIVPDLLTLPSVAGVEVVRTNERLLVRRRWLEARYVLIALCALVWDALLVGWAIYAPGPGWLLAAGPHLLVGIVGTWVAAAGLLDRTEISVGTRAIVKRTGPIPITATFQVPILRVAGFRCSPRERRHGVRVWHLLIVTRDGAVHDMLGEFDDPAVPQIVAKQLLRYLNLPEAHLEELRS